MDTSHKFTPGQKFKGLVTICDKVIAEEQASEDKKVAEVVQDAAGRSLLRCFLKGSCVGRLRRVRLVLASCRPCVSRGGRAVAARAERRCRYSLCVPSC